MVHRWRWNKRLILFLVVVIFGLVVLLLQRSVLQKNHQTSKSEFLHLSCDSQDCFAATQVRDSQPVFLGSARTNKAFVDKTNNTQEIKTILMYSFPKWYELKSGTEHFASCNLPCTITEDIGQMQNADCVVFFSHYSRLFTPPVKKVGQIWTYFAVESPHNSYEVFGSQAWLGQFNWTMTYRHDSDFYFGYGYFMKQASPSQSVDLTALVNSKFKMVAWFVSNCQTHSKREDYVQALKRFINVDIYGKCGELKCDHEGHEMCLNMLSRDYFFYLSFENSYCVDYVTEKLFNIMRIVDIVPVVRGGANYSALLPEGSYINVDDFPTIQALANHLNYLATDKAAYLKHLKWKKEYSVTAPMPLPLCELCERVHDPLQWQHIYGNIHDWWHHDTCHSPPPLKVN